MKFLLTTVESHRVDTEGEADALIQAAKEDNSFVLKKYDRAFKEKKLKGEVVDSWFVVKLTKEFNNEKEPVADVSITYGD